MKREQEWSSLTVAELEKEITVRLKLHGEMVGVLYTSILLDEVARLGLLKAAKLYGPVA